MTLRVELFWSFRSPYSYLVTPRALRLAELPGVTVDLRLVLPLALRFPERYAALPELRFSYFVRDCERTAPFLGLPFAWPRPDPVVFEPGSRRLAAAQPYIHRLTGLGLAAGRAGRGLAFIDQVSRLLWDGRTTGWDQGDHLAGAAQRAGLELAKLEAALAAKRPELEADLEANHEALTAAGHWGVPTFALDGEAFFGQDRFDQLLWRLGQRGLAVPAGLGRPGA